jgi:hypothetical protein
MINPWNTTSRYADEPWWRSGARFPCSSPRLLVGQLNDRDDDQHDQEYADYASAHPSAHVVHWKPSRCTMTAQPSSAQTHDASRCTSGNWQTSLGEGLPDDTRLFC